MLSKKQKRTYLIGAMEHVKDGGTTWRDKIKKWLRAEKIDLIIDDPCETEPEKTGYDIHESKTKAYGWKRSGSWEEFDAMFDKIIKADLECVVEADFLILYLNPNDRVGGTVSELQKAYDLSIPVYCYLDGAVSEVNSWVLRLIRKNGKIFKTWEELIYQVKEVCK